MALIRPARPIIRVSRSREELLLEFVTAAVVLGSFVVVGLYWPGLPARVPMHFNAAGKVDGWGSKSSVWIVPAAASVLTLFLTVVSLFPHTFNYLWPITADNAERQYRLARGLVVRLKLVLAVTFFVLTLATCQVAKGQGTLGFWFLPLTLASFFVVLGIYLVQAQRAR